MNEKKINIFGETGYQRELEMRRLDAIVTDEGPLFLLKLEFDVRAALREIQDDYNDEIFLDKNFNPLEDSEDTPTNTYAIQDKEGKIRVVLLSDIDETDVSFEKIKILMKSQDGKSIPGVYDILNGWIVTSLGSKSGNYLSSYPYTPNPYTDNNHMSTKMISFIFDKLYGEAKAGEYEVTYLDIIMSSKNHYLNVTQRVLNQSVVKILNTLEIQTLDQVPGYGSLTKMFADRYPGYTQEAVRKIAHKAFILGLGSNEFNSRIVKKIRGINASIHSAFGLFPENDQYAQDLALSIDIDTNNEALVVNCAAILIERTIERARQLPEKLHIIVVGKVHPHARQAIPKQFGQEELKLTVTDVELCRAECELTAISINNNHPNAINFAITLHRLQYSEVSENKFLRGKVLRGHDLTKVKEVLSNIAQESLLQKTAHFMKGTILNF